MHEDVPGSTFLITRREGLILSAVLGPDGKTLEIHADSPKPQDSPGDLFAARVEKVAQELNAAFICYGNGKNGYLQLETCQEPFWLRKGSANRMQAGNELLVQLTKLSKPPKRPVFSAELALSGSYVAVGFRPSCRAEDRKTGGGESEGGQTQAARETQQACSIGVSKKLSEEARAQWKTRIEAYLEQARSNPGDISIASVVVRTNAGQAEEETVLRELEDLKREALRIRQKAMHSRVPQVLRQNPAPWLARLGNLNLVSTKKIITDDRECYDAACAYLQQTLPGLRDVLSLHEDPLIGLSALYSLETRLDEALQKKVWMKSGAFLVIEQTEALVSIDVNTGKDSSGRRHAAQEEQYRKTNLEAAAEIARQVRLRSLGGIIIVDFINMKEESSRQSVLQCLERALRDDPEGCSRPEYTRLGLVEFTRRRVGKPLAQAIRPENDNS